MNLLRFKQTQQIVQNLRLALRLAEQKQLHEVAQRLRDALAEAERAMAEARGHMVIKGGSDLPKTGSEE